MYGVLLIVVLIITGGAIAFIGDRLGSKVGKKKLSIFGLRPRHTSIIVTIFTGVCITTLTFGVMAAASQNVRTGALWAMEKLNQKIQELYRKDGCQPSGRLPLEPSAFPDTARAVPRRGQAHYHHDGRCRRAACARRSHL